MERRVGFIGAGNMAGAIIRAMVGQKILPAANVYVYDRFPAQSARFTELGCVPVETLRALLDASDTLFWCVKPQNLAELLDEIAGLGGVGDRLNVSIVTGKPAQRYFDALGPVKLVLVMPNTPMLVGAGCAAIGEGYHTSDEEFAFVKGVFSAAGEIGVIDPARLPDMVSVHGSTPAFFYRIAKVIADYMVSTGLDADTTLRLVASTMAGSAKMLLESGMTPDALIKQVSSPGGTTLAGLAALDQAGFDDALVEGLKAAVARSYELGK